MTARRTLLIIAALLAWGFLACSKDGGGDAATPEKPTLPQYCLLVAREGRAHEEPPLPSCSFTVTTKFEPVVFRRAANIVFAQNIWGSHHTGQRDRFLRIHIYGEEAYQELVFYIGRVYHFLETPAAPQNEQQRLFDHALETWHTGTYGEGAPDPAKLAESLELFERLVAYEGVVEHLQRWALLWSAWLMLEHSDKPEEGLKRYEILAQSAETRLSAPALAHLARHYFRVGDREKGMFYAREIISRFERDSRWVQLRYMAQLMVAPNLQLPPGVSMEPKPDPEADEKEKE